MSFLVGTKGSADLYKGTDRPNRYKGARTRDWIPTRLWTPQQDIASALAVLDITAGRDPTTGAVQSWASRKGSSLATQATAANRPVYNADQFGTGRPGLSLDGTDFLTGLAVGAATKSRTICALVTFGTSTGNRTIIGGTANGDIGLRRDNEKRLQVILAGTAAIATDTVTVPDNTPVLVLASITEAGAFEFRQNGRVTTQGIAAGNAFPAANQIQIGASVSAQFLIGSFGSVFYGQEILVLDDKLRLEGWGAHRSNFGSVLVDGHPYKAAPPTA